MSYELHQARELVTYAAGSSWMERIPAERRYKMALMLAKRSRQIGDERHEKAAEDYMNRLLAEI